MSQAKEKEIIIPDTIVDKNTGKNYLKGRFFGKGGFAKCYEIRDSRTHEIFAGKIVPKSMMVKSNQREKMIQEIIIHRSLNHRHIVGFHGFFEDSHNVYIILELCRKRSMMELHKRRKALTECETRYYMNQILNGVSYLHQNRIIHRDLKLGNLFLNDELHVKIGDFGLATKVEHEGERKKTLCGTPNYIAPEILNKVGHSFEVDIWSIGCIMYTLLAGKPPFETSSLKETYARIKQVQYAVPSYMSTPAMTMISSMLKGVPSERPNVFKLLKDPFFSSGFMPASLPVSCLTMAPRLDMLELYNRKPLAAVDMNTPDKVQEIAKRVPPSPQRQKPEKQSEARKADHDITKMLQTLLELLHSLLVSIPAKEMVSTADEMTDPNAQPFVWVTKWVDYSDKYGFSYQLSDDGVGVIFNDGTRLIMLGNQYDIHYIDKEGDETYYSFDKYPATLEKKMTLLKFYLQYMNDNLLKVGYATAVKQSDSVSRPPYLYQWLRTRMSLVMVLTNGSMQINFQDHAKIILCPLMAAVTYIDTSKHFRTYRFSTLKKYGCCPMLLTYLVYAYQKLRLMMSNSFRQIEA